MWSESRLARPDKNNMAAAALKKITVELEKVTKKLEGASRPGKKAKAGDEDLDNKTLTAPIDQMAF